MYEQSSAGVLKSRSSLKLLQNSQKNTSVGVSFLMKLRVGSLKPATLLKKDSGKGSSLFKNMLLQDVIRINIFRKSRVAIRD